MTKKEFITEYEKYLNSIFMIDDDIKFTILKQDLDNLVDDNNAQFIDMILKSLDRCFMKKNPEAGFCFIVFDFGHLNYVLELSLKDDKLYHFTDFFVDYKKE
ncbi:hypothetical protein [Oceanivirga miroungae]|uniref:Uncharacterized protein n=1 Tax=Oceanivirga miroungae TaxID=1130046 RepID=A0A6I8M5W9_9FUSO|nr:hypothetical protein [Oceanivirga miroungae]VWL84792.1 hypothetical protein OMES3154_00040 [Oceanivirga miroungae]